MAPTSLRSIALELLDNLLDPSGSEAIAEAVATSHARVACVAEKIGHLPLLQELQLDYDNTIEALGGQPSALSSEYLLSELEQAGFQPDNPIRITGHDDIGLSCNGCFEKRSVFRVTASRDLFVWLNKVSQADNVLDQVLPLPHHLGKLGSRQNRDQLLDEDRCDDEAILASHESINGPLGVLTSEDATDKDVCVNDDVHARW